MLFRMRITDKFIDTSSYEYRFDTKYSLAESACYFDLFNDEKYTTYIHTVSPDEERWLQEIATNFSSAASAKTLTRDDLLRLYYEEFDQIVLLSDSGITFERDEHYKNVYRPILRHHQYKKNLFGYCPGNPEQRQFYFCLNIDYGASKHRPTLKDVFDDNDLEPSLKALFNLLIADGMAVKEPYQIDITINSGTL